MRKFAFLAVVVMSLMIATAANAAEEIWLDCFDAPSCCDITCVELDAECWCWGDCPGEVMVELYDWDGNLLGTATFDEDVCCGESWAMLDNPVSSDDVCKMRIVKGDECGLDWARISFKCEDCGCGSWKKVWKGDLCWWRSV